MSFDELIFQKFDRWVRRKKTKNISFYKLETCRNRLEALATMLNKRKTKVLAADVLTPSVKNCIFLKSEIISNGDDNLNYSFYLYQILSHHIALKYKIFYVKEISSYGETQKIHHETIYNKLKNDFPLFHIEEVYFSQFSLTVIPENKEFIFEGNEGGESGIIESKEMKKIQSKVKTKGRPDLINLDESEENPVLHNFEKVKTLDDFSGGIRSFDGTDEREEEAEAIEELQLSSIVRTESQTETMLKSDAVIENGTFVRGNEKTHEVTSKYPEWFFKEGRYREDWCSVYEKEIDLIIDHKIPEYNRPLAKMVQDQIAFLFNSNRYKNRLTDGTDIDLDRLIRFYCEKDIYQQDTPEIYSRKTKQERDFSILFLIDTSLSSDSYIENRRILDLFKNISYILADAFEEMGEQIAFYTFHSNTRNNCVVEKVKSFSEDINTLRKRISGLSPKGYTRIGAAVRHSVKILNDNKRKKNFLFILSDGKATDFDQYEGEHGQRDTKKAMDELDAISGVGHLFRFASEHKHDLVSVFSHGRLSSIKSETDFMEALLRVFHLFFRN